MIDHTFRTVTLSRAEVQRTITNAYNLPEDASFDWWEVDTIDSAFVTVQTVVAEDKAEDELLASMPQVVLEDDEDDDSFSDALYAAYAKVLEEKDNSPFVLTGIFIL